MTSADRGIVLHHRHLRHFDHAAIHHAALNHDTIVPIFIFDDQFYESDGLACDARLRFLHESLADLDPVTLLRGDPASIVSALDAPVYMIHTATGRYGVERNEALHEAGVEFIQGDGLRRVANTRDGWSDAIEDWFEELAHERPAADRFETLDHAQTTTIDAIESDFDVSPSKTGVPTGGRQAGLDQLEQFCDSPEYWGNISEPTRDAGLSGLSPYLRFGCVSIREVYQRASQELDGRDKSAFTSRLYWNLHYQQKLLDWPGWMDRAVNPELRDLGTYDSDRWHAFKQGKTGYPMIDAAVRQLKGTGWLNFRNRAMLASFVGHLLQLPWKLGADWMYYHLIDADPGINYTQWQNQTSRVGTNLFRMYNPRKQVRDSDEAADWIREWVPELADLPAQFLDQPEKTPLSVQKEHNVWIGAGYPRPIVDYDAARIKMRRELEQREAAAKQALTDDSVQERASLSARGGDPQPDVEALQSDSHQISLDQF